MASWTVRTDTPLAVGRTTTTPVSPNDRARRVSASSGDSSPAARAAMSGTHAARSTAPTVAEAVSRAAPNQRTGSTRSPNPLVGSSKNATAGRSGSRVSAETVPSPAERRRGPTGSRPSVGTRSRQPGRPSATAASNASRVPGVPRRCHVGPSLQSRTQRLAPRSAAKASRRRRNGRSSSLASMTSNIRPPDRRLSLGPAVRSVQDPSTRCPRSLWAGAEPGHGSLRPRTGSPAADPAPRTGRRTGAAGRRWRPAPSPPA